MVSFSLKEGNIFDVLMQIFPFEYIPQLDVPFSHIYNRELQLQYSSLEHDPLLHISYKFVLLKFLFLLDSLSHGHFVDPHKLNTTRIFGGRYIGPIFHTSHNTICSYVHQFSTFRTQTGSLMKKMTYNAPTPRFSIPCLWYCLPFEGSTEWVLANQMWSLTVWAPTQRWFMSSFLLKRVQKYHNFESKIPPLKV